MNIELEKVDVKENNIYKLNQEILCILLYDHSTEKNIIWGTDMYIEYGEGYESESQITIEKITGRKGQIIRPRTKRSKIEQEKRIKDKSEVFTPSWICNEQNNLIDKFWLDDNSYFNISDGLSWKTNKKKILFKDNIEWIDYVKCLRLEISCGEAPYLVSRYDSTSGQVISPENRIGLLDRKLRIINENAITYDEWNYYVELAFKSVYGYEWQGDSLLIARENLLYTYIDYYFDKFNKSPDIENLKKISEIISWNIFQMDGLKYVVPNSCKNDVQINYTLFGTEEIKIECLGCKKEKNKKHNGIYVKIMNWETNRKIKFISLLKKGDKNERN